MPTVELIYDGDCPNVPHARENLLRTFSQAGIASRWREWDRAEADILAYACAFGSPTVLMAGKDTADLLGDFPEHILRVAALGAAWG